MLDTLSFSSSTTFDNKSLRESQGIYNETARIKRRIVSLLKDQFSHYVRRDIASNRFARPRACRLFSKKDLTMWDDSISIISSETDPSPNRAGESEFRLEESQLQVLQNGNKLSKKVVEIILEFEKEMSDDLDFSILSAGEQKRLRHSTREVLWKL